MSNVVKVQFEGSVSEAMSESFRRKLSKLVSYNMVREDSLGKFVKEMLFSFAEPLLYVRKVQ